MISYGPFDFRYTIWDSHVCVHRRMNIHRHLSDYNLLLCVGQAGNVIGSDFWSLVFVSKKPVNFNIFYRGGCALLPIYLYPNPEKNDLFNNGSEATDAPGGRKPNLSPEFIREFSSKLKMEFIPDGKGDLKNNFGPEDIFHYIYAVLHSPSYRERYADFLRIDFPRIPLTSNKTLFQRLCLQGERLIGLHLMEKYSAKLPGYPIDGDHIVVKVRYTEPGQGSDKGRVWINKTQYFEDVPLNVWEFMIGGYQVCQKWLKDRKRKGRKLEFDDLEHYRRIVGAIHDTIEIMSEIDAIIDENGGWPIQ